MCLEKPLTLPFTPHRELPEIFDIVASARVKTMRKWKTRQSGQDFILERARPVVSMWRRGDCVLENKLFSAY